MQRNDYGSDPWDGSSVNRPVSDINASNLSIVENSAIGSVVGEFNATDPDGDTNHTFTLIPYPPKLWLDAADTTGVISCRWKFKPLEKQGIHSVRRSSYQR